MAIEPRKRRQSRPKSPAERIQILLTKLWGDNQRSMADAIGCSQPLLSMIVSGSRQPGPKLLELVAKHPKVNPEWLRSGYGEPILAEPTLDSLPIAEVVLPGPPLENRELLLAHRYPVLPGAFATTRHWFRVRRNQPVVDSKNAKVRDGDLLLMESDFSQFWLSNFRGLAIVRLPRDNGTEVRLCRIWPKKLQSPDGKTIFNVDDFAYEENHKLVRQVTTLEYPDGKEATFEEFIVMSPQAANGEAPIERRLNPSGRELFLSALSEDIVAVALQLVREAP